MAAATLRFAYYVPEADLDDLNARLRRARWPDQSLGAAGAKGTDLAGLQSLVTTAYGRFPRGGHFAAMERSEALVQVIRVF